MTHHLKSNRTQLATSKREDRYVGDHVKQWETGQLSNVSPSEEKRVSQRLHKAIRRVASRYLLEANHKANLSFTSVKSIGKKCAGNEGKKRLFQLSLNRTDPWLQTLRTVPVRAHYAKLQDASWLFPRSSAKPWCGSVIAATSATHRILGDMAKRTNREHLPGSNLNIFLCLLPMKGIK